MNLLLATKQLLIIIWVCAISGQIAFAPFVFSQTEMASAEDQLMPAEDQSPASFFVRFYQRFISVFDGDRCPMYPTCSQYSLQCFKKHGFLMGWIMTCDRLLHEPDEMQLAPVVIINGQARFFDPVQSNDQWWYNK
ncbi:MAG: hypothetical protein OMM_07540, partial [Candidatus Magnetoglobus multicellularis str. Araruama]